MQFTIDKQQHNSIFVDSALELRKLALVNHKGRSITYEQLFSAVSQVCEILDEVGADPYQDSIIIATGEKILDAIVALACIERYLRFTIIDRKRKISYRAYVCEHSEATIVFSSRSNLLETEGDSWISNRVRHGFELKIIASKIKIDTFLERQPRFTSQVTHLGEIAPQALFYTSGSTGRPKGIAVSRQLLLDGAECVSGYLKLEPDDVILSYLPTSFDYGFNQLLCSIRVGATLALEDDFAPLKFSSHCAQIKPTVLPGSPSIFLSVGKLINRYTDLSKFKSIRLLTNTGGRIPEAGHTFIRLLVATFGTKPFLMYGLTESFRSSFLPPELYEVKHNAIGRAVPGVSLFLYDNNGQIIQTPHTIGEIVHVGRLISYGYYKDTLATEKIIAPFNHPAFDGIPNPPLAVRSGDLGYFDEDRIFFHMGRKDSLVKVREQRTNLDQIEDMISRLNLFDACVVMGDCDDDGMTIIHIIGTLARNLRDLNTVRSVLLEVLPVHLAGYKLTIKEEMPTNLNGKICRRTLAHELSLLQEAIKNV